MKLAVSFDMDSDNIARNFDGTLFFKMYDIDDGEVICSEIMSTMGKFGAENLSEMLILLKADALLCGEISEEAEMPLMTKAFLSTAALTGMPMTLYRALSAESITLNK